MPQGPWQSRKKCVAFLRGGGGGGSPKNVHMTFLVVTIDMWPFPKVEGKAPNTVIIQDENWKHNWSVCRQCYVLRCTCYGRSPTCDLNSAKCSNMTAYLNWYSVGLRTLIYVELTTYMKLVEKVTTGADDRLMAWFLKRNKPTPDLLQQLVVYVVQKRSFHFFAMIMLNALINLRVELPSWCYNTSRRVCFNGGTVEMW